MYKLLVSIFSLLFYVFPTALLASSLVNEITISEELTLSTFYKAYSFYFIVIYTLIFALSMFAIYIFKEKVRTLIDKVLEKLFKRGELKDLKNDINHIKSNLKNQSNYLPSVIHGTSNFDKIICVMTPSPLFIFNSIISIYYHENEYEKLIGVGRVSNIQEDQKIQIEVIKIINEEINHSIFQAISNNDNTKISKLIIKPNISIDYLNENLKP